MFYEEFFNYSKLEPKFSINKRNYTQREMNLTPVTFNRTVPVKKI